MALEVHLIPETYPCCPGPSVWLRASEHPEGTWVLLGCLFHPEPCCMAPCVIFTLILPYFLFHQARGKKRQIGWFPANYVKLLSPGTSKITPTEPPKPPAFPAGKHPTLPYAGSKTARSSSLHVPLAFVPNFLLQGLSGHLLPPSLSTLWAGPKPWADYRIPLSKEVPKSEQPHGGQGQQNPC